MTLLRSSRIFFALVLLLTAALPRPCLAQDNPDYRLLTGDTVRITVFNNPDLQVDSRVAENGSINYPLVGSVVLGGLTVVKAEKKLLQVLQLNGIDIDARQLSLVLVKAPTLPGPAVPANDKDNYRLGPGDSIRIAVFQNPDMLLETRVSDNGAITYPLVGVVQIGGMTVVAAEQKLTKLLKDGGYVLDPQLSITLMQVRGNQVSVLGLVTKPGRYPLEQTRMKVTDALALAGGVIPGAADHVVLVGMRDGKLMRKTVDLTAMIVSGSPEDNAQIQNGDIVFVNKAPVFYISGEVNKPGSYRIERDMTLMQALAAGGGISLRGTDWGIRVFRRDAATGKAEKIDLDMQDPIQSDDVIQVRKSLF